jgi:hypothetical protein
MPYNLAKNRNQSIVPRKSFLRNNTGVLFVLLITNFEFQVNTSRAILSKKPGVDGSEYINATYFHVNIFSFP